MSNYYLNFFTFIEWLGVGFTLLYNLLLIRQNLWCWLFGILSSFCGVIVFYHTQLYGQAILYLFYAGMGAYGFVYWKQAKKKQVSIIVWQAKKQMVVFLSCVLLSVASYFITNYYYSNISFFDVFLSVFSIMATYKETRKVLSGWLYWIVLNLLSSVLFYNNNLTGFFILSLIYTVLSMYGFLAWKKALSASV